MNMVRNEQLNDRGYVECPHDSHMIHLNLTIVLHRIHLGNIAKKTEKAEKKVELKTETHLGYAIVISSENIVWIVEYSIAENYPIGSVFFSVHYSFSCSFFSLIWFDHYFDLHC